jgi:hypothetical protein
VSGALLQSVSLCSDGALELLQMKWGAEQPCAGRCASTCPRHVHGVWKMGTRIRIGTSGATGTPTTVPAGGTAPFLSSWTQWGRPLQCSSNATKRPTPREHAPPFAAAGRCHRKNCVPLHGVRTVHGVRSVRVCVACAVHVQPDGPACVSDL